MSTPQWITLSPANWIVIECETCFFHILLFIQKKLIFNRTRLLLDFSFDKLDDWVIIFASFHAYWAHPLLEADSLTIPSHLKLILYILETCFGHNCWGTNITSTFSNDDPFWHFLQVSGKELIHPPECHWLWGRARWVPPQGRVTPFSHHTDNKLYFPCECRLRWHLFSLELIRSFHKKGLRSLSQLSKNKKFVCLLNLSLLSLFILFLSLIWKVATFFKKYFSSVDKLIFPQAALRCFFAFHPIDVLPLHVCIY